MRRAQPARPAAHAAGATTGTHSASAGRVPSGGHSKRVRLGERFWRLWWATALSSTGDGLVGMVALPLLALTMTHSAVLIAGVTAVNRASAALAALPAGLLTDRRERRSLMAASELLPGLVLGGLVVAMSLRVADLAMVYAAAVVVAVCEVTYKLALQAVFPDVVASRDQLAVGNGRLMSVDAAGEQVIGPAVGGFLFSAAQRLPFLADAVSFVTSAVLVRTSVPAAPNPAAPNPAEQPVGDVAGSPSALQPAQDGKGPPAPSAYKFKPTWRDDLRTGFRVFNSNLSLKLLAGAVSAGSFNQNMVIALVVIYGRHVLSLSSTGYGAFLAGAAVLGVVGLFFGGAAQRRLGASGVVIVGSLACGLSYLGMSAAGLAWLAAVAFGLQELGTAVINVGSVTTRQQIIPKELFGRVGSVHRLFVQTAAPAGAIVGGLVADAWGVRSALLVAGVLELMLIGVLTPALRRNLPGVAVPSQSAPTP